MNLFEKLNRLDDSLVESKTIVKKKKLTESAYDPYPAGEYGDRIFKILDKCSAEDIIKFIKEYGWNFYMSGESIRDVYDHINSYLESHSGYGLWSELAEYFEESDFDDDIDEMLTESEETYELSALVKDSINHLVNDLGKDPMADDFGDDVCADLEDNYDIEVPQNMVKYADWCDAVMSEVSRQINKVEEQLTEGNNVSSQLPPAIDSFLQDIAQMYETIDYKDIMQHEYSEEDIRKLKNLRRRFRAEVPYEGDEEADQIMQDIAEKVAVIVKR